jgi:hypothetical protein
MPCATSLACLPLEMSRATLSLRLARRSPCPHCGRETKTVEGVCADCWGTKEQGRRQFFVEKRGGSPGWFFLDDLLWLPVVLALGIAVIFIVRST